MLITGDRLMLRPKFIVKLTIPVSGGTYTYTYHFISCFTRNTERAWLIMSSSLDANIARPYRDG